MPKKITESQMIGERGIALVHQRVSAMGFLWTATGGTEAGTDGYIEIRHPATGDVLASVLKVQSKATERRWQAETDSSFEFVCRAKDIEYWLASNVPVILICSRPKTNEAYWKFVSDYFGDGDGRRSHKVVLDKQVDRFDVGAAQALIDVAVPHAAGIYAPPPARAEQLVSNLLEVVSFAEHIYVAPAQCPTEKLAREELRGEGVGGEWILRSKQLISFQPLDGAPWHRVCDTGAAERFSSLEWADSDDPVKLREFVELLNRALREKVKPELAFHRARNLYYFRATDVDTKIVGLRRVFHGYENKRDPSRISYYRHSALRAQFHRFDHRWYLEMTPEYLFTSNGWKDSRYHADYLKKMKRIERNDAVRQQVAFWAGYLGAPDNLLSPAYAFLEFGESLSFDVDFGFDEKQWRTPDEESTEKALADPDSLELFDAA
jgi:hypothetical protein